jgi:VanZ like family
MPSLRWRWPLIGVAWCGLIAATSSTVILPHDFFVLAAARVFTDDTSLRAFVAFWRRWWFPIVKGWHAAEFAILFVVLLLALDRLLGARPRRNVLFALFLCFLFALSDEYHQTFVPGRGGTWVDVSIDVFGAGLAGMIAWLWRCRRAVRNRENRS